MAAQGNTAETVREDLPDIDQTERESDKHLQEAKEVQIPVPGELASFRDFKVVGTLPAQGAEADFYFIENNKGRYLLKLYRTAIAPPEQLLNKIMELSRSNPKHLVAIFEIGFDEKTGRWFEIMEYIRLGSLQGVNLSGVDRRALVRALIKELAVAIHLLHLHGIIHCDLKPSNILVRSTKPFNLVLTDFGIASLLTPDISIKMTSLKGTPLYWAPEAFNGLVSPASDWWSLGIIAMEYLAGSHPFSGLRQQQITYQLTVSNVDVPESLGEESQLLRGLLTKDSKRRWGYKEVLRWLGGERNIPVHYETELVRAAQPASKQQPFNFEGENINSVDEAAIVFARSEHNWGQVGQYARYFLQWLEKSGQIDKAVQVAEILENPNTSDIALFHFIHSTVTLPFIYMGVEIDAPKIASCLSKQRAGNASPAEKAIAQSVEDGTLCSLYADYCRYNSVESPPLTPLLTLLAEVESDKLDAYAQAAAYPQDHLWPNFPASVPTGNPVAMLRALKRAPLSVELLTAIRGRYALPKTVTAQLQQCDLYESAIAELRHLNESKLLIHSEHAQNMQIQRDPNGDIPMDYEQYTKMAKRFNWGMDAVLQQKIESLTLFLEGLSASERKKSFNINSTIQKLKELHNRPINNSDRAFVEEATNCVKRYTSGGAGQKRFLAQLLPLLLLIPIAFMMWLPLSDATTFELLIYLVLFTPCVQKGYNSFSSSSPKALLLSLARIVVHLLPLFFLLGARLFFFGKAPISPAFILNKWTQLQPLYAMISRHSALVQIAKYGMGALAAIWVVLRWRRTSKDQSGTWQVEMGAELNQLSFKTTTVSSGLGVLTFDEFGENLREEFGV